MTTMRTDVATLHAPTTKPAQSQKGNALIEFAFVLPVFLLLLIGMMTFSLALYNKTMLTMAVQQGARAGAIASTDQRTEAETAGNLACSGKLISIGTVAGSPVTASISGDMLTVTASFDYVGLDFLGLYPYNVPISAQTSMRLESP
jgi:Flp pilus assembly protein TadG